ncbi:hypothetical protein KCP73_01830 [Salmonella enterica subsp. enterica]|nr:hypothetical protein KCP73_01830 [Salmonella enterica subsp. enterica]
MCCRAEVRAGWKFTRPVQQVETKALAPRDFSPSAVSRVRHWLDLADYG